MQVKYSSFQIFTLFKTYFRCFLVVIFCILSFSAGFCLGNSKSLKTERRPDLHSESGEFSIEGVQSAVEERDSNIEETKKLIERCFPYYNDYNLGLVSCPMCGK